MRWEEPEEAFAHLLLVWGRLEREDDVSERDQDLLRDLLDDLLTGLYQDGRDAAPCLFQPREAHRPGLSDVERHRTMIAYSWAIEDLGQGASKTAIVEEMAAHLKITPNAVRHRLQLLRNKA